MLADLSFDAITVDKVSAFDNKEIEVDILRLDKIDPVISGNKWFKLRYYLEEARTLQKKGILTFGGAWSNHIVATAAICTINGSEIGRHYSRRRTEKTFLYPIKGKRIGNGINSLFPALTITTKRYQLGFKQVNTSIVNEGGYGETGAKGASTILDYCRDKYTHYCCAVGTGTMMAGIINAVSPVQQVTGISVLKNNMGLHEMVQTLVVKEKSNWQLIHDYHFGGYAKHQPALLDFMNQFYKRSSIPTDFVYTGKLFYAVSDLISKNYFPSGSKVLLIHSGGLQGNTSLLKGRLIF